MICFVWMIGVGPGPSLAMSLLSNPLCSGIWQTWQVGTGRDRKAAKLLLVKLPVEATAV